MLPLCRLRPRLRLVFGRYWALLNEDRDERDPHALGPGRRLLRGLLEVLLRLLKVFFFAFLFLRFSNGLRHAMAHLHPVFLAHFGPR